MRREGLAVVACALVACGSARAPAPGEPLVVSPPSRAASSPPALAPVDEPVPGAWNVELAYRGWQARPSEIVVAAGGVYIVGPVFDPRTVEVRRWAVAKLDAATGKPLWSVLDDAAHGPMPEHMVLTDEALIVAGQESDDLAGRALIFERRDPATGALVWRQRIADRMRGQYLGGIAVHRGSLFYASTGDDKAAPPQATFGELSLATGKPVRPSITRADRRGRHIAANDQGVYLLGENRAGAYSLETIDTRWQPVTTQSTGTLLRMAWHGDALVGWFATVEKHVPGGQRVWASPLVATFLDVAVADAIYVTAMMDASGDAYFALHELDAATGEVAWTRRTAEYGKSRPPLALAVHEDAIYLFGYVDDRWWVERRRKRDGALGPIAPSQYALAPASPQLAK